MFLTKRHLSRREVLRGAGVTLALPLLDAMIPAATALAQTAAAPKMRMGFFYIPHGAIMGNTSHGPPGQVSFRQEHGQSFLEHVAQFDDEPQRAQRSRRRRRDSLCSSCLCGSGISILLPDSEMQPQKHESTKSMDRCMENLT